VVCRWLPVQLVAAGMKGVDEKIDNLLCSLVKAEPANPVNTGSASGRRFDFPMSFDFAVNIRSRSTYTIY
jgi:hypothetical protein